MMLAADDVDQAMVAVVALAWALPNGLLGWVDDHRPQAIGRKFAVQIGAAALAVYLGLRLESVAVPPFGEVSLGVLSWPISILWLVWVANLFNLMDGMDALAAGSATVFFTGYGVLAFGSGAFGLSLLAVGCAGTCVGFLRYNWPPARIFMGDAGSLFCGAALGGLGLALARGDGGGVPIAVSAILLGPFAFDATYTIARRVIRRVPRPWSAHRTHIYQRLVTAGWTQRRVRGTYFGLAAVFAVIAVSLPGWPRTWQAAGLGAALGGCAALVLAMWAAEAEASEDADEWTSGSSVTGPDSTDGSTDSSADD
jgi:UDP-GlcNAc:undecaprenyl-phosphate GlcNAc-1-phosphate transferase